ncbi:sugar transferase [Bifidobacterium jacchi]|nr:sugar transferase [Bifidobacterium jacchi]
MAEPTIRMSSRPGDTDTAAQSQTASQMQSQAASPTAATVSANDMRTMQLPISRTGNPRQTGGRTRMTATNNANTSATIPINASIRNAAAPTAAIPSIPQATFFDGSYASIETAASMNSGKSGKSGKSSQPGSGASSSAASSSAPGQRNRGGASGGTRTTYRRRPTWLPVIPKWRYVYNATLVVLDALMMIVSCSFIFLIRPDILSTVQAQLPGGAAATVSVFSLTWLVSLAIIRSYHRHTMGEGYDLYAKILTAAFINFIALCFIAYFFAVPYPRWLVGLASIFSVLLTLVERWLMRRALHRNRRHGEYNYPTVIVGSPEGIHDTIDRLSTVVGLSVGYAPIAVCPIAQATIEDDPNAPQHLIAVPFTPRNERESKLRVLALNSRLAQTAKQIGAQTVLIADVLTRDSETMRTLSLAVESANMELALTTSVADLGGSQLVLRTNMALPVLSASLPQYSWPTRLLKRAIDIAGALIALIPGSIIMAIVAVAIKMEDGGPVFYKQERIGIYGNPFYCLKLRSMRVNADKLDAQVAAQAGVDLGTTFKVKNDPRITRVGRFIRKTSIDEIPQFINVLKGDMSLVGPRPQRQYEVDQYSTLYSTRLLVRPGITGPWQISGRNDLSPKDAEFLDVNYVENWSLMTDIAILIKTVGVVLRGDGAY